MDNPKTIEEILAELSPESQESLQEHLATMRKSVIRNAIAAVMVRNQSHNLGDNVKQQVPKPETKK